ncbi:MAG: hypothetical protein HZA36_00850 [Parcubacteria group bacterium]|nr:hypothetical protein [Parcubacteria group bacterium]
MKNVLGMNALAEVAGTLKDFFEKLGGDNGMGWLEAFKRFLRKENVWEEETVFVITSVAELGFENGAKFRDIINHAWKRGLVLCPNNNLGKDMFRLYNWYKETFKHRLKLEYFFIAVHPVVSGAGDWSILGMQCDKPYADPRGSSSCFYCCEADLERFFGGKEYFVFVKKK